MYKCYYSNYKTWWKYGAGDCGPCLFYHVRRRRLAAGRVLALGLTIALFWLRTRLCLAAAVPWPCRGTTATHPSHLEPCFAVALPRQCAAADLGC